MNYSNTEIEKAILGSLLEYKDEAIEQALSVLDDLDFTSPKCQETWKAITEMHNKGMKIDFILATKYITEKNCGVDASDMIDFYNCQTTLSYFCQYIYELREYRIKREVQLIVDDKKEGFLEELEEKFEEIRNLQISKETATIRDFLPDYLDNLQKKKDSFVGLSSGFNELDKLTLGFEPATIIILAARPSHGKTVFAINLLIYSAITLNKKVAFFSLETSKAKIMNRILSNLTEIPLHYIRQRELNEDNLNKIVKASCVIAESNNIFINEEADDLNSIVLEIKNLKRKYDISFVMVDFLQLIHIKGNREKRNYELEVISRKFKKLSKELDIAIMLLSQLNRDIDYRTDHRPKLSDLRDSGGIEQDADLVLFMLNKSKYNSEDNPGIVNFYLDKNKDGETGEFVLEFDGARMKFK